MENQQPTGEAQNSQKPFYKKWWGVILIIMFLPIFAIWYIWAKTKWSKLVKSIVTAVVVIITMAAIGSNNSKDQTNQPAQQVATAPAQETNNNQPAQPAETQAQDNTPAPPTPPTDQPSLEKSLATIVTGVSSDMSYKSINVEKSDTDRPKGTQMITVSVNVKTYSSKDGLLMDTGKLSSQIYQAVYSVPSMKAYDVIVWYYMDIIDRYGNTSSGVALAYSTDKPTYEKINWQNFDQTKLCDFLNNEATITGVVGNTSCNILTKI